MGSGVDSLLAKVHPTGVRPGPGDGPLHGGSVQGTPVRLSSSEMIPGEAAGPPARPVAITDVEFVVSGMD